MFCSLSLSFPLKASGFNEKLHLIVDIFCECMKSLAQMSTERQFRVAVQQQLKDYENFLRQSDQLSLYFSFNAIQWQIPTMFQINTELKAITFADFQEFCQKFGEEMRIKALIQGNVTEHHAHGIINKMLNVLKFKKIENVSEITEKSKGIGVITSFLLLFFPPFSHWQFN